MGGELRRVRLGEAAPRVTHHCVLPACCQLQQALHESFLRHRPRWDLIAYGSNASREQFTCNRCRRKGSFKPRPADACVAKPAQSVLASPTTHRARVVARVAAPAVRDFFCTGISRPNSEVGRQSDPTLRGRAITQAAPKKSAAPRHAPHLPAHHARRRRRARCRARMTSRPKSA